MSENEHYRYILFREVSLVDSSEDNGVLAFIMLNPSTAKAVGTDRKRDNDKTINRCIDFAKHWGYGQLLVVNLFARVATKPEDLARKADSGQKIIGAGNDDTIRVVAAMGDKVVCAWGDDISKVSDGQDRAKKVLEMIRLQGKTPYHLGSFTNKDNPRHPSRLRGNTKLQPWNPTS